MLSRSFALSWEYLYISDSENYPPVNTDTERPGQDWGGVKFEVLSVKGRIEPILEIDSIHLLNT
ncbi:hypothetical protein DESC_320060 [Desulfosarcina cetonica]|nr:hypothetical protein DESC_320060 [Desulfosarcina cetonica]